MGTKNNPGPYDCFEVAEPDEPVFVLCGRDVTAPMLVLAWVAGRSALNAAGVLTTEEAKLVEAANCARAMWKFAEEKGKGARLEAMARVLEITEDFIAFFKAPDGAPEVEEFLEDLRKRDG